MQSSKSKITRRLLAAGVAAGLIYVGLWFLQVFIRPGYDPTRHDLSLLANGDLGWIQVANFIITGLLVLMAAFGFKQALRGGRGRTWAPLMLGLYGLGLIGAGLFAADPMAGFPVGTPEGAPANPTMNGFMHIITGALGFVGLIAACFVMARYFAAEKLKGWKVFSIATGVIFFAGFVGIAGASQQTGAVLVTVTLAFSAAVLLGWTWLSLVSYKLMSKLGSH